MSQIELAYDNSYYFTPNGPICTSIYFQNKGKLVSHYLRSATFKRDILCLLPLDIFYPVVHIDYLTIKIINIPQPPSPKMALCRLGLPIPSSAYRAFSRSETSWSSSGGWVSDGWLGEWQLAGWVTVGWVADGVNPNLSWQLPGSSYIQLASWLTTKYFIKPRPCSLLLCWALCRQVWPVQI